MFRLTLFPDGHFEDFATLEAALNEGLRVYPTVGDRVAGLIPPGTGQYHGYNQFGELKFQIDTLAEPTELDK